MSAYCWKVYDWPLQAWERWHKCFSTPVCRTVYQHFITSSPFINTFACDIILSPFFLLKQEWIWRVGRKAGNYLSACLNCEKIFEKHGQPNRRLSPQASAGFEPAAKTVCKIFNFFWGVISGREIMDRICAPWNNNGRQRFFFCAWCSWLCLLWARPNFVRLTFERDIKMWLIELLGEWTPQKVGVSAILLSKTLSHFTNRIRHENNQRNKFTQKKKNYNTSLFIFICLHARKRLTKHLWTSQDITQDTSWFPYPCSE